MFHFSTLTRKYCRWLQRYYIAIILVSLISSIVGAYYTVELYKNLRTDIEELLPETAQSVRDLKKAAGRVTGLNHLEVVIESNDIEAAKRFQIDVTAKLEKLPKTIVEKVKSNIRVERKFFDTYKSLYAETSDLESALKYIQNKKHTAKKKMFDLGLDDDGTVAPQAAEFDHDKLKQKLKDKLHDFENFKDDYFQSKDGKTRIVLAFLPGKVTNMQGNEALSNAATQIIEELNPSKYASDMRVGLGGDVQNMVEEHHGLVSDLINSFVIVSALVTLVLWLYYKSFGAVFALSMSLFVGICWTFGISFFLVGYLNANTAFLGSIVIGNGINFGIIFLARYIEERKRSVSQEEALHTSLTYTARATATAALAAGFAYGSLMLTHFRGFNQFGIIGALGMLLCWLSAFTTMPALLICLEKRGRISYRLRSDAIPLMRWIAELVVRSYKLIAIASALISVVAIFGALRFSKHTLESDLSKLRNKESLLRGSGFWGHKTDAAFGRNLTPTIVLTDSPEGMAKVYTVLKKEHLDAGDSSPFSSLATLNDLVPSDQTKKIELLKKIRAELSPQVLKRLSPEERELVNEFIPQTSPSPFQAAQLPPDVLANFKESDGRLYTMIHVYPHMGAENSSSTASATGTWNGEEVIRYTNMLREAIKSAGVDAVIAGQPPISADMLTAILRDGPKATFVAFLAVMLLVLIMFPHFRNASSILFALWLGVLWMGGFIGLVGWKINFLNFITLPITFGIGVDYAVNILGRFHDERRNGKELSIPHVIKSTGGAVLLCSSTTIIGYSSLLLSGSQAFVSFGHLAVLGEITCITAALVSMPSIWIWKEKLKKKA